MILPRHWVRYDLWVSVTDVRKAKAGRLGFSLGLRATDQCSSYRKRDVTLNLTKLFITTLNMSEHYHLFIRIKWRLMWRKHNIRHLAVTPVPFIDIVSRSGNMWKSVGTSNNIYPTSMFGLLLNFAQIRTNRMKYRLVFSRSFYQMFHITNNISIQSRPHPLKKDFSHLLTTTQVRYVLAPLWNLIHFWR